MDANFKINANSSIYAGQEIYRRFVFEDYIKLIQVKRIV